MAKRQVVAVGIEGGMKSIESAKKRQVVAGGGASKPAAGSSKSKATADASKNGKSGRRVCWL